MHLIIIGPQASGKGTQADLIAKRLGIPHLASGDLLRQKKRSGSELGEKIAALIDEGKMVPDTLIWHMIEKELLKHPEGWILDGFPRTREQAKILDEKYALEKVIQLKVPDDVCVERISGRRICESCGQDYHIKYKPPKEEGKCDIDGGKLVQRADDNPESVRKRLADYHKKTEPMLKHYKQLLVKVNGNQGIEEVWQEIQKKLGI